MSTSDLIEDPDAMYAALWVAVGVLLLFVARRTYGILLAGGLVGVVVTTQLFVTGLVVIVLAVVERWDIQRYDRYLAGWIIYTLLVLAIYNFMVMPSDFYASDVSLFESWAAHLITRGRNPTDANMLVAREAWEISSKSAKITPTRDGGVVTSYSYPGGTLWLSTLEQWFVPGNRLGIANAVASAGFAAWLVRRVNQGLVPLALLAFLAPVLRPVSASMGMITPLWLWPLAAGLAAWYDGRIDHAGFGFGIAVASKQLAWPIAGLALIHVLRTRGRLAAGRLILVAGSASFLLVGWLIAWNPVSWAISAIFPFLPLGDPLVAQGVGLTSLTVGGVVEVPRTLHRVLVFAVAGSLIGATWRYPDQMQWLIPFATILVLLVHYRTLPSYYAATVPLSIVALDARFKA